MNKLCTSINQSQKLIGLGIDVNTADMYWSMEEIPYMPFPVNDIVTDWDYAQENGMLPAWSLSALLNFLPDELTDSDGYVYRNAFFHLKGKYIIQYPKLSTLWPSLFSVESDDPIDACYEMIIKLHEQNLL